MKYLCRLWKANFIRLFDTEIGVCGVLQIQLYNCRMEKEEPSFAGFNERKVNLLCTPPSMLCELSYEAAQKEDFNYYRVEPGTEFFRIKKGPLADNTLKITKNLPENEIEPSFIPQG